MRIFGALVLVMTGCFSLSDEAATPERSEGHNEMRRDAGIFDDAGVRDDAGVSDDAGVRDDAGPQQGSDSPCQASCDVDNWCFWKSENSNYSAGCHSVKTDDPAAESLRTMTQGRCVDFGNSCESDDDCRGIDNEGRDRCIDGPDDEAKCGRPEGICPSGASDCDFGRPCVEFPLEPQIVEQMNGRCVYDDHDFDDLLDGRLGYILDNDSCGLLACYDDPEASCSLYLEGMQDFNPAATVVDCAQIPESDSAETCDWRECEDSDWQCERRYFTSGAVCDDGWCAIGEGNSRRYFNQMLHGMAVNRGSLGVQPCRDICGNGNPRAGGGEFCRLEVQNSGQLTCISCENNEGCGADSGLACEDGRCVFPCEDDDECLSAQRCETGRCVEDHQQRQGGPCDDPNMTCGGGTQCQEIRVHGDAGQQWNHPYCASDTCDDTQLCEPGLRCEREPNRQGHCQFTDLCNTNDHCGGGACDNIVVQGEEKSLCLKIGVHCGRDEDCSDGDTCILGLCGSQGTPNQSCPDPAYTQFVGTCAPNSPPLPDCGEGCVQGYNCWGEQRNDLLLSNCVPNACNQQVPCPEHMVCTGGTCSFRGFCNGTDDCGGSDQCTEGQPLCLYLPDNYCECDADNGETCVLGLCNDSGAAMGECSEELFIGVCTTP
jgi:hypothetical protein